MNINFIGLGKLGLPLSLIMANNGVAVNAIDKNEKLIKLLNENKPPWTEPGLSNYIKGAKKNITYTTSYENVYKNPISVILVNTPSDPNTRAFLNIFIEQSIKEICENLKANNIKSHTFIISSTVMPGTIMNNIVPLIESIMGWQFGKHFNVAYVPDFVALGNIFDGFKNPDLLLIGSEGDLSIVNELYKNYVLSSPSKIPIVNLTIPEAELAKVTLNAYITTKISFANHVGVLAKRLSGKINSSKVLNAVGLDKRIGNAYFKSGAPYGGTCFPRDTWAYTEICNANDLIPGHMIVNEQINNLVVEDICYEIMNSNPKSIGIIGLSFKPDTSVTTEGFAKKVVKYLIEHSTIEMKVFDDNPQAIENFQLEGIEDSNFHVDTGVDMSTVDIILYCHPYNSTYENLRTELKEKYNIKENCILITPWEN